MELRQQGLHSHAITLTSSTMLAHMRPPVWILSRPVPTSSGSDPNQSFYSASRICVCVENGLFILVYRPFPHPTAVSWMSSQVLEHPTKHSYPYACTRYLTSSLLMVFFYENNASWAFWLVNLHIFRIILFFYFYFLAVWCGTWDVSSRPGIERVPPALEMWRLNHWTAREVPGLYYWDNSEDLLNRSEVSMYFRASEYL